MCFLCVASAAHFLFSYTISNDVLCLTILALNDIIKVLRNFNKLPSMEQSMCLFDKNTYSYSHACLCWMLKFRSRNRSCVFFVRGFGCALFVFCGDFMSIKEQTCCFTGHRFIDPNEVETVFENTKEVVSLLASKGVKFFGTGGALGFDTIAAKAVLDVKETHPEIKLILVLPCENQMKYWKQIDIDVYNELLNKADKVKYLSKSYYDGCMQKRNRHLVDCSSYCVCYLKKQTGGTAYTVDYAKSKNVKIINVVEG